LVKPFCAVEEDAQHALRPEELNCFFDGFTGSAIRSYYQQAAVHMLYQCYRIRKRGHWWSVDENPIEARREPL
jgi:hypothetical protein